MANKDLFKQAIAEAKSVREAAIANAKDALEETLTPHLKDMLAAKLQEMEDKSTDEEVVNELEDDVEEAKGHDDEKVDEAPKPKDDEKDEAVEEDLSVAPEVAEAEEDEAEDDSEESEDEAEADMEDAGEVEVEDEVDGDEELGDLTVDQFKDLIRDIVAQEMGGGEEDMGAPDMDAGDIEGMGDEAPIEEPEGDIGDEEEIDVQEEEIDLDELLRELETVSEGDDEVEEAKHKDEKDENVKEVSTAKSTEVQDTADSQAQGTNINRTVNEEELNQALETIEQLKKDLHETNLLNSKLLYVNKIFKANNLSESQKVNVIAAFDKAETVKEVKLVFETVSENVITKKETVTESKVRGMASKATGTTATKPEVINEVSDAVRRMQQLAGIIK